MGGELDATREKEKNGSGKGTLRPRQRTKGEETGTRYQKLMKISTAEACPLEGKSYTLNLK
jgi:hypothetical protein